MGTSFMAKRRLAVVYQGHGSFKYPQQEFLMPFARKRL